MAYLFMILTLLCMSCSQKVHNQSHSIESYKIAKSRPQAAQRVQAETLALVVIDPGHGGESFGTKTVTLPHIYEKTLSLQCSQQVAKFLEEWGYTVRLTRKKDETVSLAKRVQIAKGGSFFVSIHFNHAPNADANGIEIFYYSDDRQSKRRDLSKMLAQDILRFSVRETGCFSRGVHPGNFHVIRENTIPAVLVEGGFCSNVIEARKLVDQKYIRKLAFAIARGIDNFSLNHFATKKIS